MLSIILLINTHKIINMVEMLLLPKIEKVFSPGFENGGFITWYQENRYEMLDKLFIAIYCLDKCSQIYKIQIWN